LQALKNRSKEIPNLISPHLGDRVQANWSIVAAVFSDQPALEKTSAKEQPAAPVVRALPLGGRIKVDPWHDQLRLLKSKPVGTVAEAENLPFQITPFVFYLTRQGTASSIKTAGTAAAKPDLELDPRISETQEQTLRLLTPDISPQP
jgi:hypothetical protein